MQNSLSIKREILEEGANMQSNPALEYDYSIAKLFLFATIAFGIVGLLLGVVIAFQMAFPDLNYLLLF